MQDRRAVTPGQRVPGKFGQAGAGTGIIYSAEENLHSARGTLAFWIRVPQLPGPHDIERLIGAGEPASSFIDHDLYASQTA
jgi:hypothetical protein